MLDVSPTPGLKGLRNIPGVGKQIARDLRDLGIHSVQDLIGRDPQALYAELCELQGAQVDRCMLYVFRCAIYFASNEQHDPELLKWWNWKDQKAKHESSATRNVSVSAATCR